VGLPLFSLEVFILNPLCFGIATFFIRGLCFEPTNKDCNNAPSFMALAYLAYQLLSNTELALLVISMMVINVLGEQSLYYCFGVTWASPR
jgi:hypothetical protein